MWAVRWHLRSKRGCHQSRPGMEERSYVGSSGGPSLNHASGEPSPTSDLEPDFWPKPIPAASHWSCLLCGHASNLLAPIWEDTRTETGKRPAPRSHRPPPHPRAGQGGVRGWVPLAPHHGRLPCYRWLGCPGGLQMTK